MPGGTRLKQREQDRIHRVLVRPCKSSCCPRPRWRPHAQDIKDRSLKFAFSLAKDHPFGIGAQKFADLVAQKSGGKMKVSVIP